MYGSRKSLHCDLQGEVVSGVLNVGSRAWDATAGGRHGEVDLDESKALDSKATAECPC